MNKELIGKYGRAKIFASILDSTTEEQINNLINSPVTKNRYVAVMPDCHAGKGCTIGTTMRINNKINPSLVGVDIGCGVMAIPLGKIELDMEKVDNFFHNYMPSGREVNEEVIEDFDLESLYCFDMLTDVNRLRKSLMSLGGGNHFCEIDKDDEDNKYLVIHTGSRNLGLQVANIYSEIAYNQTNVDTIVTKEDIKEIVEKYKAEGRPFEINMAIESFKRKKNSLAVVSKEESWLVKEEKDKYLHDMKICQEFAYRNRYLIASNFLYKILNYSKEQVDEVMNNRIETTHNYIDFTVAGDPILRKGAVSAQKDEILLIPMNMKEGTLICRGKGNPDWNYSAPHGAGRLYSRASARSSFTIEEFKESMKDIYTTCVTENTLDESPMAYKPYEIIMKDIEDTVEIINIIKPIYNFKAEG